MFRKIACLFRIDSSDLALSFPNSEVEAQGCYPLNFPSSSGGAPTHSPSTRPTPAHQ